MCGAHGFENGGAVDRLQKCIELAGVAGELDRVALFGVEALCGRERCRHALISSRSLPMRAL